MKNNFEAVPLAARLRPRTIDEFVGQERILGKGTPLRQSIESGKLMSLVLWGPPGVGKTTLAYIVADKVKAEAERVSAVAAGVADLKEVISRAKERKKIGVGTVLIVDEIHRFNKAQQDVLLPVVEDGLVILIGVTTENPYFEVVKALISRVQVVRMEALSEKEVFKVVERALEDERFGLKGNKKILKEAGQLLARLAGGDGRRALNILEGAALLSSANIITKKDVEKASQTKAVNYDKKGDAHYDTISAFIKSMRGSDPDAALFYLFRMLMAGEDPKFIVRRMLIFASEDIGNADPHSLMLASSAAQTLEWVGLPEAEFALAHAAVYLAAAPKSNSIYKAKEAAKRDVKRHGNDEPPGHIVNAPVDDLKRFGKGVGYKYPHNYPGHLVKQQYRPEAIQNNLYYEPGDDGFEKEVKRRVEKARGILGQNSKFQNPKFE